MTKLVGNKAC